MTKKIPSLFGGAMIIAGGTIGAGMLANPTSTAGVWFLGSTLILIYTWFCMTTSGLMLLEANLHYPTGASFDTIVKDLLGKGWNLINGVSVAFVLYILTYAYITSGGGITQGFFNQLLSSTENAVDIGRSSGSLIFCIVLAGFVWFSTKAVDRFSVVLIAGMVISFFLSITNLVGSVNTEVLLNAVQGEQQYLPYALVALPVCLVSFGFHQNVPSLGLYYYIADLFKFDDSVAGRTKTALITFLPPLLLSLQFPYGFVLAIGYAGLAATIWAVIVPALLAKASRKKFKSSSFTAYGGNFMIYFVIAFGLLNIFAQLAMQFGFLPEFRG